MGYARYSADRDRRARAALLEDDSDEVFDAAATLLLALKASAPTSSTVRDDIRAMDGAVEACVGASQQPLTAARAPRLRELAAWLDADYVAEP